MKKSAELVPGEKLLWEGRPERGPFLMTQLKNVVVGLAQIAALVAVVLFIDRTNWPGAVTTTIKILCIPGFLIAGLGVLSPVLASGAYTIARYKITNQRIIVVEGLKTASVRDLSLKEVDTVKLEHGWKNRPFGTGTVHITAEPGNETAWVYGIFLGIKDADTVVATLNDAVADARAKMKKRR